MTLFADFIGNALFSIFAGPLIMLLIAAAILIPIQIWRMKMAMNDPERFQRLRAWEEEETARQKKILGDVANVGMKGIGLGKSVLGRFMKK
jgi:hypothetical protein